MLAWYQFDGPDFDIEVSFDSQLFLPVLFPFVSGVLSDHNHLGDVSYSLIGPAPGNLFEAPADFSKDSFQ